VLYQPDHDGECRECGRTPTVHVVGHLKPDTELCGPHFFADGLMIDPDKWNEQEENEDDLQLSNGD
jgi:hypothetical protein